MNRALVAFVVMVVAILTFLPDAQAKVSGPNGRIAFFFQQRGDNKVRKPGTQDFAPDWGTHPPTGG